MFLTIDWYNITFVINNINPLHLNCDLEGSFTLSQGVIVLNEIPIKIKQRLFVRCLTSLSTL